MKKFLILLAVIALFVQSLCQSCVYADDIQNQNVQQGYKIIHYDRDGQISGWTINRPDRMKNYDRNGKLIGLTRNVITKINNKDSGWTINLSNRIERYDSNGRLVDFTEKIGNTITHYDSLGWKVDTAVFSGNKVTQTYYDRNGKITNVVVNENN